ncbi:MAG TPA: N-acetyl-gamma-glutamyl-phosphate reductase [Acidisarcina sp.]|nr:N-acetyl-gamma-glutamyl-phosphate reductase [Acidisarcina sp.]
MKDGTIQTAIVGVSGYAGMELARILLHHPRLAEAPPVLTGRVEDGRESVPFAALYPQLMDHHGSPELKMEPFSWDLLEERKVDVLFLATPHEQSRSWVPEAIDRSLRVVDLSGAWRLDESENRAVYNLTDEDPERAAELQIESVYGMPELHRAKLAKARLVANPGCYATSIILALKPLISAGWVNTESGIVCDSKSGVSGAGKAPTAKTHFMHAADNLSAYGIFTHRHVGELLEQLELDQDEITFAPHLLPIPRGILSTIYVTFWEPKTAAEVNRRYHKFFAHSPLVRVFGTQVPQLQYSVRTNYCDIGFQLSSDGRRCVIVSCLDNLLKGAAGQAVQNMNLMYGWNEAEGLV